MSVDGLIGAIRSATGGDHERVDALFAGFDLTRRDHYARFLHAHARALPAVEAVLVDHPALPRWRSRRAALHDDLRDLGEDAPEPIAFAPPGDAAAAWGMLYVIEGSRLGGVMLARQVGADLPTRYLGARHLPGEWRALLAGMQDAAAAGEGGWAERVIEAAQATFALYARAVSAPR